MPVARNSSSLCAALQGGECIRAANGQRGTVWAISSYLLLLAQRLPITAISLGEYLRRGEEGEGGGEEEERRRGGGEVVRW